MSEDERALMRTVLAHPDEDVPRLVLADYLEENGNPERAEFIRLQCEARCPIPMVYPPMVYPGPSGDSGRMDRLAGEFGVSWLGAVETPRLLRAVWERGFVTQVTADLTWWCGGSGYRVMCSHIVRRVAAFGWHAAPAQWATPVRWWLTFPITVGSFRSLFELASRMCPPGDVTYGQSHLFDYSVIQFDSSEEADAVVSRTLIKYANLTGPVAGNPAGRPRL